MTCAEGARGVAVRTRGTVFSRNSDIGAKPAGLENEGISRLPDRSAVETIRDQGLGSWTIFPMDKTNNNNARLCAAQTMVRC